MGSSWGKRSGSSLAAGPSSAILSPLVPGQGVPMRVVSLALACMLVMAGAAYAQNLSFGSINGTVTDTSGGALPGVTVTASSPALQVGQLTAVTDGEGKYQIVD